MPDMPNAVLSVMSPTNVTSNKNWSATKQITQKQVE